MEQWKQPVRVERTGGKEEESFQHRRRLARMIRLQSRLSRTWFGSERRRVRAMQLDPAELGEKDWRVLKEKIWSSRVIIDSSTDPLHAPNSTTAARQFGVSFDALEGLWTHIIPLPSRTQAEALSVTLLDRIRPNPDRQVTVLNRRKLDGLELRGTSSVKALETDTVCADRVRLGMTGRELIVVAAVGNVAFGVGYGCLGEGWTQDHFAGVAQLQADKIHAQVRSESPSL